MASPCSKSITYIVAGPPTAAIASPTENQLVPTGSTIQTTFSCVPGASAPSLSSCKDSRGTSAPHGTLDTRTAGAHTYTVTAIAAGGQTGTATVHYTVADNPSATIEPLPHPTPKDHVSPAVLLRRHEVQLRRGRRRTGPRRLRRLARDGRPHRHA